MEVASLLALLFWQCSALFGFIGAFPLFLLLAAAPDDFRGR